MGRFHALLDREVVTAVGKLGLSRSEFDVLTALLATADGEARPGDLSAGLLLTTGGTSNILRRLERERLVERAGGSSDRRSYRIRLTPAGAARAREALSLVDARLTQLLASMEIDAIRSGTEILHELLTQLGEDGPVHQL
ncbi:MULTISPECIES: MarR family winged helix-turn-helix transcriptional regulator [Amycolatopsis]|uniref:MarR family winged helix-turn-helix transcriptional regulator n=1 Tax=Amycolatopsis TaxID=1813 RepID=UPI001F01817E|nr:MarR family transcriptional regulator [Amycolatopsis tucumanensis]MCF6424149.1 MarR family transcriptional regulator [Amycolatopsis tucumanensis]